MDSSTPQFAIREVAQMTGVKPVTLRAWQRRYHLLQPQRTEKGHRLYSQDEIDLIKAIQAWLAKGVAIGKVAQLLQDNTNESLHEVEIKQELDESNLLRTALAKLNRGQADAVLAAVLKEYPLDIVETQLITPVLQSFEHVKNNIRTLQRALFQTLVISRLNVIIESENKASHRGKMLCISLDPVGSLYAWLNATKQAERGYHVTLLDGVAELGGLLDNDLLTQFAAVDLFSNRALTEQQHRQLRLIAQSHASVSVSGAMTLLHQFED